eukprot:scaffold268028_cov43-Prasinocladus_malaysianus.AAC.1
MNARLAPMQQIRSSPMTIPTITMIATGELRSPKASGAVDGGDGGAGGVQAAGSPATMRSSGSAITASTAALTSDASDAKTSAMSQRESMAPGGFMALQDHTMCNATDLLGLNA